MKKWIVVTFFLALFLCGGIPSYADYGTANDSAEIQAATDDRTVDATGSCGDSATYTLYSDGELVISGSGSIKNYAFSSYNGPGVIKRLTIYDGITDIGYRAFYNCKNLKTVTIPDSVTGFFLDAEFPASSVFFCSHHKIGKRYHLDMRCDPKF